MYYSNSELEVQELKDIIKQKLKVDVMERKRSRHIVDARMIYCKILRDRGYTVSFISASLKKDHTTIVYYMSVIDDIMTQLPLMSDNYVSCRDAFMEGKEPIVMQRHSVLKSRIEKLEEKLRKAELLQYKINSLEEKLKKTEIIKKKESRLKDIIELVDLRTPPGYERLVERKINEMFNSLKTK